MRKLVKLHGTETVLEEGWNLTSSAPHSFILSLPDGLALDITYDATLEAMPNEPVPVENVAHFPGYDPSENSTYSNPTYEYSSGGGVTVTTPPSVEVTKQNQLNTAQKLRGAVFTLEQYDVVDGELVFVSTLDTRPTDINGVVSFGQDTSLILATDTVYCLTESQAPAGFIKDDSKHFFVITKQLEDGTYPEYPEEVTRWAYEVSPNYSCIIYDMPILPRLPATGGAGRDIVYIIGSALVLCAAALLFMKKRKN